VRATLAIDDPDDPRIADYRAVRERDLAGRAGKFVIEGEVPLRLAAARGRFALASALLSDKRAALAEAIPEGVPVYVAAQPVLEAIAGFPIHRGVLAIGVRGEAPDAAALLDEDTVAQIAEMGALSGAGFLARIVGLYCEHAPPALAALVDAVRDAAAPDAVASAAHSLKSMSLNIGAAALAARLAEIETAAREEGRLPAAEALPGLEVLLADTITTLRERFQDAGEGEGVARVG